MKACDTVDCSFVALLHVKLTGTFHYIIIQKDKHIPKAAAMAGRSIALVGGREGVALCCFHSHPQVLSSHSGTEHILLHHSILCAW